MAHGGVLSALYAHLRGDDISNFEKFSPKNTAITIVEVENKQHEIKLLNCSVHLKNLKKL